MDKNKLFRFIAYFKIGDGCWNWEGNLNKAGYGRFSFMNERWLAHRVSYELFVGPIPNEALDHLCRNPRCVNPDHLEPVTIGENVRRGNAGKYQQNPTCPEGHEYDRVYFKRDSGTPTRQCSICNKRKCKDWYYRNKAPDKIGGERTL